jgi:hypothetical protein
MALSLTGFLFADDYNANAKAVIASAHFQLSTFNFQKPIRIFGCAGISDVTFKRKVAVVSQP